MEGQFLFKYIAENVIIMNIWCKKFVSMCCTMVLMEFHIWQGAFNVSITNLLHMHLKLMRVVLFLQEEMLHAFAEAVNEKSSWKWIREVEAVLLSCLDSRECASCPSNAKSENFQMDLWKW